MNITKKDICQAIADSTGLTRVDTQIIVQKDRLMLEGVTFDGKQNQRTEKNLSFAGSGG